jgi:glycosyltransferase involved in cell wall biosynthesis
MSVRLPTDLTALARRARSTASRLSRLSAREIARRAAHRIAHRLGTEDGDSLVLPADVADSYALRTPRRASRPAGARPRVAWVAFPPSAGSGGHTTLFRVMESARAAGFDCTLLLYDRFASDLDQRTRIIRSTWPWLQAEIAPVPAEIQGYDAVVATSWPTAHVVATRTAEGRRLYFAQDFEPYFSPRGATYALAEDTYRFGFRTIALGHMVHDELLAQTGVESDLVPFGCDTETYHLLPGAGRRSGVVFYAKKGNDRRGYRLALRALAIFHDHHPDEPIHVYGDTVDSAPFPVVNHGTLAPAELNALYNTVVAGYALSFTNISLVAEELLAAGVVPVVNDSPLARADLPSPYALWADATPTALAAALGTAVTRPDRDEHALKAASSVVGRSWEPTGAAVAAILAAETGVSGEA